MNHQQPSHLPSLFQNVSYPSPFPPLNQSIPDLYRGAFPNAGPTTHSLFLSSIFSPQATNIAGAVPVANHLCSDFGTPNLYHPAVPNGVDVVGHLSAAGQYPILPMFAALDANMRPSSSLTLSNLSQRNLHPSCLENNSSAPSYASPPVQNNNDGAHPSPSSSLSSLSVEAKHSDKSPFAQPNSHGDCNGITGNSPSNVSTTSPICYRQRKTNNDTPSITSASPQAPNQSPLLYNDVSSKKRRNSSPKSSLHAVAATSADLHSSAPAILRNTNNNSSTFNHYSSCTNFVAGATGGNQHAGGSVCSSLPLVPHFDPAELEQNSFFTHNVDPSLTTAVDEALSVLGKDVSIDLDAIAPNVVNQTFWEDLGDSVLDDVALLAGTSASVDTTSLLHSVFEFSSLTNPSFDDMVSPPNSGPNCSFVEPTPPSSSPHHGANSSSTLSSDNSMTPKLKEKMKRKEREIAELDREFARHLNMVVEKNERNFLSSTETPSTSASAPVSGGYSAIGGQSNSAFESYSSELYFPLPAAFASLTQRDERRVTRDNDAVVSPVRFSPVSDGESGDETERKSKIASAVSLFIPIADEPDGSADQPSTSSACAATAQHVQQTTTTQTKWAPRKSKKVPIYKQNNNALSGSKNKLASKKSHQNSDSPYCFTDEDDEEQIVSPKTSTSHASASHHHHHINNGGGSREIVAPVENVKEKLVEEEVNRKLLQISCLHPELRLAAVKDGLKHAVACELSSLKATTQKLHHHNNFTAGNSSSASTFVQRQNSAPITQPTSASEQFSDLLRHVVPKKRLSASNRGAVSCSDMTPKSFVGGAGVNFNFLTSQSASTTTPTTMIPVGALSRLSALNISSSVSSVAAAVASNSSSEKFSKLDTFVKTEIIPDNETAKPSSYSLSSTGDACKTNERTSTSSKEADESSEKPLDPLKPKLIIRIPKQCLANVNLEQNNDNDDELSNGDNDYDDVKYENDESTTIDRCSYRKHRHKHKHKRKHKKERRSLDDEESKEEYKKRRRLHRFSVENGEISSKKRKRFIISSESDECRSSFSGDESLINSAKTSLGQLDVCASDKCSEDANSTKNRKKLRLLHSQSVCNPGATSNATDGVVIGQVCPLTNGGTPLDSSERVQKPLFSQTAVFQKGAFVICKEDIPKSDCPLWKVDSQNLLQKFVPLEKDSKIVYQGSSTYAGWCVQNQDQYVAVQVKFLHFTRSECVVELENSLLELFPAVSREITDNIEVAVSSSSNDQENVFNASNFDHPIKEALQTYVQVLVLHCVLGNYLQSLHQRNDINLLKQLNEVDIYNYEKKKKIASDVKWSKKFEEALEWYPFCTVNEDDGSGLHCQACERNVVENVLQLFANEGYDFDTLEARPPKTTVSGSPLPSQDFHVCPSCADAAVLYHKLVHMRYHIFKKCVDKVDIIRGDNRSMDATLIVEQCLRHKNWIISALQEYLNIWSKIS